MKRYEALKHAVKAHGATLDKCGKLYVLHPIAVAEAVDAPYLSLFASPERETMAVVALLHDIWEDTPYRPSGLTERQDKAMRLLTRWPEETYKRYLDGFCTCPYVDVRQVACIVKLADLWHNLQPERQDCLPEKERKSLEARYLKARDQIWEALGYEWWPGEGPS